MFNKIKDLSQILVSCYVLRLLITGATIGDALVIASLSGLYGFYRYLDSKKEPVANQELKDRISGLETKTSNMDNKLGVLTLRR